MKKRERQRELRYLEHGQEQVLFAGFVLVTVQGEHDGLQQRINLGQADQTAQSCNVARLGLEQEEQVAVGLQLAVIGEQAIRLVSFLQMFSNLTLLLLFELSCKSMLLVGNSGCGVVVLS
jgi:hypothetical protein